MYAAVNSVSYSVVPGLSVGIADSSMLDGQLTFSIAVTVAEFSYVALVISVSADDNSFDVPGLSNIQFGTTGSSMSCSGNGSFFDRLSQVPLGAIIGAVVGGVIFIAAMIVLCVCCSRRRRRLQMQQMTQQTTAMNVPMLDYTPVKL